MHDIAELRSPPSASIMEEIAAFLASFVRAGELDNPLPGDEQEKRWAKRLNWWWLLNPFCRTDSPLAVILRERGGKIVGFAGFIPHDYELDGKTVPALISTTFFVSEEHRGKAMSMILRAERFARDHHMVDGSPSDKMQRILERLKYEHCSFETQHIYIVRRVGMAPKALLSRIGSALSRQGSRAAFMRPAHFIHQSDDIASIPPRRDNTLRRRITREGLSWFMASGSEPKSLVAVCDAHRSLIAYGIGVMRKARGRTILRFVDYSCFDQSFDLDSLFSYAATHPEAFGLSAQLDVLAWPTFNRPISNKTFLRRQRPAALYYKVPSTWQYTGKDALPDEGDLPLL